MNPEFFRAPPLARSKGSPQGQDWLGCLRKSGGISSLADQERAYIEWVLKEHGDNKSLAAQSLGIDRVSLWRKIKKYELEG